MTLRTDSEHASNFPSPQYQALSSPNRPKTHEVDFVTEEMIRNHSHSHALSAILGANGHISTPASLIDTTRPSSPHVPTTESMTSTFHREDVHPEQAEKNEGPARLAIWKRQKKRWKRVLFWLVACLWFIGTFSLTFAAPAQLQLLAPIGLGASLSLLSTFVVLMSFFKRQTVRRRPNELLAFVALSECGLAVLTLLHVVTMCSGATGVCQAMEFTSCTVATSLEIFFFVAGVGWFGANIFHLFVSLSNPFAQYKKQVILYHSLVWLLALVLSLVTPWMVFSTHMEKTLRLSRTELCRMVDFILPLLPSDANQSMANKLQRLGQWQDVNLAYWGLVMATIVVIVVAAQCGLMLGWWRATSGTILALKARRRLMKRMAVYVHALNGMWVVVLVVFFLYRSNYAALTSIPVHGARAATARVNVLNAVFHFVVTAKGSLTAVVWVHVNKPCCALAFCTSCGVHACPRHDDDDDDDDDPARLDVAHAVALSSVHRARGARTAQSIESGIHGPCPLRDASSSPSALERREALRRAPVSPPWSLSQALAPRPSRSVSSSSEAASSVASYEASQTNETLQREIIYYTVCGITKAIVRAAHGAAAERGATGIGAEADLVETTLVVGAERDASLVNNAFLAHVQQVTSLSAPRAYCCDPPGGHSRPPPTLRRATGSGTQRVSCTSIVGYRSTQGARPGAPLDPSSCHAGPSSRYPVSHVPFELFDHEITLASTRSSREASEETMRATVLASLRRTATSVRRPDGVPADAKPKVFVDYAPRAFRAIRVAFGLSDEKYLASFRTTAKERVSAGSSGAFMFYSGDTSLVVKSLKEKECRALVAMAPAYAAYLAAHPASRLMRFFGCHRVRLYGRNFYFAVMSNVLYSDAHTPTMVEKYDVKGSWIDRRARRAQRGERVTCAECTATYTYSGRDEERDALAGHVHRPEIVLKDLDWTRSLHLARPVAAQLLAQLHADSAFLCSVGIMDYSLLIGVHTCHFRPPVLASVARPRTEDVGPVNLAPLGETEVYFVGIIDILQQWDWEKQVEKAGKVLLGKPARGISAMAPAAYCRRFQARCREIVVGHAATGDDGEGMDTCRGDETMADVAHVV
ncbi:hypothetical protein PsorP6_016322 [Peronosclerospora sorghi]|uniref:Uncharacterized protein n=1 Tax=Peronosclerospora sorghi TaxID=230839 RepID=A0ACC0VN51_9STRA|nr:hypothetical protein PsorP6_016322 [Peronosclerospora sorghi]